MHKKTSLSKYFTTVEKLMWSCSSAMIILSYLLFDRSSSMTLAASLIGVTALIFTAKGNPIGPALMVVFSIFYGIISYSFAYYGEEKKPEILSGHLLEAIIGLTGEIVLTPAEGCIGRKYIEELGIRIWDFE